MALRLVGKGRGSDPETWSTVYNGSLGHTNVVVGSSRPSHEHRIESCQVEVVVQHSSKVHLCSALILTSLHHHL